MSLVGNNMNFFWTTSSSSVILNGSSDSLYVGKNSSQTITPASSVNVTLDSADSNDYVMFWGTSETLNIDNGATTTNVYLEQSNSQLSVNGSGATATFEGNNGDVMYVTGSDLIDNAGNEGSGTENVVIAGTDSTLNIEDQPTGVWITTGTTVNDLENDKDTIVIFGNGNTYNGSDAKVYINTSNQNDNTITGNSSTVYFNGSNDVTYLTNSGETGFTFNGTSATGLDTVILADNSTNSIVGGNVDYWATNSNTVTANASGNTFVWFGSSNQLNGSGEKVYMNVSGATDAVSGNSDAITINGSNDTYFFTAGDTPGTIVLNGTGDKVYVGNELVASSATPPSQPSSHLKLIEAMASFGGTESLEGDRLTHPISLTTIPHSLAIAHG